MFTPILKSKPNEDISILIKADNHAFNYICECGDASDLTVKDCQQTNAIFISHAHIDHIINFDFILRHQIGIQRRVIICGPKGITQKIQSKILGYEWNLISSDAITYEIREIHENGTIIRSEIQPPTWKIKPLENIVSTTVYSNKIFDVYYTILDHKTASIAYLFKEKDTIKIDLSNSNHTPGSWVRELKEAYEHQKPENLIQIKDTQYKASELFYLLSIKQGDTVGIIMDHKANEENHEKIKTLFSNCNKVFIESFYKEEDKELADLNYHSYSKASGKIMKNCKVPNAIPVHFSRKYNTEEIEQLSTEFFNSYNN